MTADYNKTNLKKQSSAYRNSCMRYFFQLQIFKGKSFNYCSSAFKRIAFNGDVV